MARNSTTFGPGNPHARRGNGAGWGGPAKGAGVAPGTPSPGRPAGEAWAGKATVADLMAADGGREEAAKRWMAILRNPKHPKHAEMVAKAAERMDGAPTQRLEVRDADPDTMTDAELEAIAARGRSAAAGTATGTDQP